MKLLQLNIWGGRLEQPILNLFKHEDPDIICLQEAIDLKGGKSAMFASTEEIQAVIGAKYIFMSPVFSLNYMNRKADFGNCIISKFPISESKTIFTGGEYIDDFDVLDHDLNIRNLQQAVIELPQNIKLNILNHHGHHIKHHKNGDNETKRQCIMIADIARKLDGPIILAGDFNLSPHSRSLEIINSLLINLSIKPKLKTTRTNLTHKTEVCDYIFTNNQIKVKSFIALDNIVSDHKALALTFL